MGTKFLLYLSNMLSTTGGKELQAPSILIVIRVVQSTLMN